MRCDREPHIHPGAIQVDSLAPAHLTLRATLRQPPERLPRRLGHRRVDIPCTARKLHNLIELPRDLVCSHPGSQSPAGLPAAPVNLHRPRCCARWANLRLLFLQPSQTFGSPRSPCAPVQPSAFPEWHRSGRYFDLRLPSGAAPFGPTFGCSSYGLPSPPVPVPSIPDGTPCRPRATKQSYL